MIAENLAEIHDRIGRAANRAGRSVEAIRVVAAAKGQGKKKIEEAVAAGIRLIGHNYVQEAEEESVLPPGDDLEFHMIGHLQKNKVGKAVDLFQVIQTVDDSRVAEAINRRCEGLGRTMGVMIQVNLAKEPQKSGVGEEEVEKLVEAIRNFPNLRILGLMTMPPFFDDPDRARPYFASLRNMRNRFLNTGVLAPEMRELSMGMTGDFEAAVEEGATLVRIGTALFGPRE